MHNKVKLIAFYLPQFHPIPENDNWWGKGFTEWTNVVTAKPLFKGHYQPHIPSNLGFYDLRTAETRQAQADLAKEFGIYGFCYYHYWFNGKKLLERPFNNVLQSGKPDFPFCLAWANETWSRKWHGMEEDILLSQTYGGDEDDISHIRWLIKAFKDYRYISIYNKPIFLVYRADKLLNPSRTVEIWRNEVEKAGFKGIYLISIETSFNPNWNPISAGFDASLVFQPQFHKLIQLKQNKSIIKNLINKLKKHNSRLIFDYKKYWNYLDEFEDVNFYRYFTVCPRWDNTPRRRNSPFILNNSTPEEYYKWLVKVIKRVINQPDDQRIVFINAWNEWAEGNHLEPDLKYGLKYLEITKKALLDINKIQY